MRVAEVSGVGHGPAFVPEKEPADVSPEVGPAVRPQHYSAGKPRIGLVPPRALLEMARVMTDAHESGKYPPAEDGTPNYLIGDGVEPVEYLESCGRHWNALCRGEMVDAKSGLPHAAHLAVDAAIYLELLKHRGLMP